MQPRTVCSQNSYIRKRASNFSVTMIVMGASFGLYYLGLFGTIDGPLTPANIGGSLAALGVTRWHLLELSAALTVLAISWNWFYNGFRRAAQRRGRPGRTEAPEPIRKGTVGHVFWILSLALTVIVFINVVP